MFISIISEIDIPFSAISYVLRIYFYCMTFDMNTERKILQSVRYLYLKLQIWFGFNFLIPCCHFHDGWKPWICWHSFFEMYPQCRQFWKSLFRTKKEQSTSELKYFFKYYEFSFIFCFENISKSKIFQKHFRVLKINLILSSIGFYP